MSLFNYFLKYFSKFESNKPTIKSLFDHNFFDSKYYLHPSASTEDFSILLNISTDQLDQISKFYYNCLFETLINKFKYKYFFEELNNPINSNLKIDSIMKLCGFQNKEKFVKYLKQNEFINQEYNEY